MTTEMPSTLGEYLAGQFALANEIVGSINSLNSYLSELPADLDRTSFMEFMSEDDGGHYSMLEEAKQAALELAVSLSLALHASYVMDLELMNKLSVDRDLANPDKRDEALRRIIQHKKALELLEKPKRVELHRTAADVMPAARMAA